MKMFFAISILTVTLGSNALASSKVCFGSTKNEETKGLVMTAEITEGQIILKTVKGDFYNGTYSAANSTINGRDGETYLEYNGEDSDYQDDIMVDQNLLQDSTTGLLQIRARGEGFFNSVFVCKDAR